MPIAELAPHHPGAEATIELVPVSFAGHFGTLHRPAGRVGSGLTVVISLPVGREGCCVYRHFVEWGNSLARRGAQVLRFDPRGEGDSFPVDPDRDQWRCWLDGLCSAVDLARALTEPRSLALVGLRLGATLAMAAAERTSPDALVLLAPIMAGATYIKQLRLSAAVQSLAAEPGEMAVDGMQLSTATLEQIDRLDMTGVVPTWRRLFLAGPKPEPVHAAALGGDVTTTPFHGYSRLFRDTHLSEAPERVLTQISDWLEQGLPGEAPAAPLPRSVRRAPAELRTPHWVEEPVLFGEGLRGILCRPAQGTGRKAVVLANTGADPRGSCGGFTTFACRALAGAGIAALRFDFLGLGESEGRRDGPTHVYATSHVDEYRAAAAILARNGFDDLTLVGVCTGGYHAIRAVIEEPLFTRALAFNSWLVWRPGTPLGFRAIRMKDVIYSTSWQTRFRRLLRGEMNLLQKAPGLAHRVRQLWYRWRGDAASRAVQSELVRASRQGKKILVVLGRKDQAVDDLESDFGRKFRRIGQVKGLSIRTVPDLDHALHSRRSKAIALGEILQFVDPDALARRAADFADHETAVRRLGPEPADGGRAGSTHAVPLSHPG